MSTCLYYACTEKKNILAVYIGMVTQEYNNGPRHIRVLRNIQAEVKRDRYTVSEKPEKETEKDGNSHTLL